MWMNEYDIDDAARRVAHDDERPNLRAAVGILDRLKDWTNRNSDGWPYWKAPIRAADKLMTAIQSRIYGSGVAGGDIPEGDLKRALTPIKSFLTKQQNAKRMTAADRLWILEGDPDD